MKKQIAVVLCLLPLGLIAQIRGFVVQGKLIGLPEDALVYMAGKTEKDTIAVTHAKQGSFVLKGRVEETDSRMLVFPSIGRRMVLFMGNDQVHISGTSKDFSDVSITGSAAHLDYEDFLLYIKPLNDYVEYYRMRIKTAATAASRDSILPMLNTAYNIYQTSIDRFVARKKNSPVSALVLAYCYDTDPNKDLATLEKRMALLNGEALNNQFARSLRQVMQVAKIGSVGSQAIEFTQADSNGKPIALSQFRGKYVLLDFWASWCRPCRMENPNVVAAYNRFKDKNFTVIGVSLDQDKESWLKAVAADQLNWTQLSDLQYWNNAVARAYHIESIPQNYLIGPDGVILARDLRGQELVSKLNELLK